MTEFTTLIPETIISLVGAMMMVLSPGMRRMHSRLPERLCAAGLLTAAIATLLTWGQRATAFSGMVRIDEFSQLARVLLLGISLCICIMSADFLHREQANFGEYYSLLLFATAGACLMAVSSDLILTFLGIEVLSIASYVLTGFKRDKPRGVEAALKYFLLGSFSTAFFLYGVALLYGQTGTTHYAAVMTRLHAAPDAVTLAALALILTGFGFKIAMAPFHIWAPDVYEGAPTPVTAFLATASKTAAFLALARLLYIALAGLNRGWGDILWIAAAITMFAGNLAALQQTNIKRLLAYSSIAHAGYMLIGLASRNRSGVEAMLFYLLAYGLMNLGAFCVIQVISRPDSQSALVSDYRGLVYRHRWLAVAFSLFLFSLAGIPGTAGFMGKFLLFSAGIQQGLSRLVFLAVVNSAIAVYYYSRVVVTMFMQSPDPPQEEIQTPSATGFVLVVAALGTLLLGVFPGLVASLIEAAAAALFQ